MLATEYLGDRTPGFEGILNGGSTISTKTSAIHEAVLFGEYFFVKPSGKPCNGWTRRATPAR